MDNGVAIGIDPSLTGTAICVMELEDPSRYTLRRFSSDPVRGETKDELLRGRMRRYRTLLHEIRDHLAAPLSRARAICLEGYSFASQHSSEVLAEFGALLRVYLVDEAPPQCLLLETAPSTLKKFVTGRGDRRGKLHVVASLSKRFGVEFGTDDEYDAFGLARLALYAACPDLAEAKHEKDCLKRLLSPRGKK